MSAVGLVSASGLVLAVAGPAQAASCGESLSDWQLLNVAAVYQGSSTGVFNDFVVDSLTVTLLAGNASIRVVERNGNARQLNVPVLLTRSGGEPALRMVEKGDGDHYAVTLERPVCANALLPTMVTSGGFDIYTDENGRAGSSGAVTRVL
ncbi:hypothetical protein [Kineosporia babensis]|uniref:Uncharacterized protein n=1 Tax=Kineosporia babensis TaxID=499548 RepID=A0A9X1T2Q8_9ACTN|nr:hypothetical protein [Kineosporia babensis]MCD5314908.1 hypothetical protein [Kineosporia babensis]